MGKSLDLACEVVPEWASLSAGPKEWKGKESATQSASGLAKHVTQLAGAITQTTGTLEECRRHVEGFLKDYPEYDMPELERLSALTSEAVKGMEERINKATTDLSNARTLVTERDKELSEFRAGGIGEGMSDDEVEALVANTDMAALQAEITDLDTECQSLVGKRGGEKQKLKDNTDKRAARKERGLQMEEALKVHTLWKGLNDLFGDKTGSTFRRIALSFILTDLLKSANRYMNTLMPRYRLSCQPGSFLIKVEDQYQGFQQRAASSISGGESFVVSLALALALADIGESLSVDTLFIDEGFGSLSGEPLHMAIETLRALHTNGGRRVGIISHIAALREQVPVKIKVDRPAGSSAATVTVEGPKKGFASVGKND